MGSFSTPEVIHIVINRNENSLTWPKAHHVKKLFFLVCHNNHKIIIVIAGFIISENRVKTIVGRIIALIFPKFI
ncbi:MAG: hypothetical protein WCG25_03355 [bacterium]